MKQKEAIRNILAVKVRNDWNFSDREGEAKLQPSEGLPGGDKGESTRWIERAEWLSECPTSEDEDDESDEDDEDEKPLEEAAEHAANKKKLRRQRKLNAELAYNEGLRCFTARRNAWTDAHIVKSTDETNANKEDSDKEDILDTYLPIAPPLLPPDTPMRRNITSRAHGTIYDKVISHSQTPFCPINLQTIVDSCVDGWKRDGEWPPKDSQPDASLSRPKAVEVHRERGAWKRSLQRVFGRAAPEIV